MNGTLTLEQSAIREVSSLFGNDSALKKLISFTKKLRKESREAVADESDVMTEADKKQILAEIKEGLIEVKMVEQGKRKSRPIMELINEL